MEEANQKKYLQRLFQDGNYPTLPRSLNHGSSLEQFRVARKLLGEDAWKDMMESKLGCVAKLAENKFIFCGRMLFYFLTRQLETKKQMEMWSLIGVDPLRFSLYEFSKITGLNCDPYGDDVGVNVDHTELWAKMGLAVGDGPHWTDMLRVLKICGGWTSTEQMSVGFLCLLHVGVFGFQRGCRIDLKYAKKALDKKVFNSFQWGRHAFEVLIKSIKETNLAASSVTLNGFVHGVNVWALESYTKLGEMHGGRKIVDELPILRWSGSRAHYNVDDVILAAKSENYEVRNMVMKQMKEIYPDWPNEVDDERVDTLLEDIINQRLQKKELTWEWHGRVLDGQKHKSPGNKKRESSEHNSKDGIAGPVGKKNKKVKMKDGCEHNGETSANAEVVNLLKSVFEKLGEMDSHNRHQFSAIGTRFVEVEDQMGLMKGAIRSLQNDAKVEGKKPVLQQEVVEATCSSKNLKQARDDVHGDIDVENSTPDSWLERPTQVKKNPKVKKADKPAVGKNTGNSEKVVKVKVEPAEKFGTPKKKGNRKKKCVKLVIEDVGDEDNTYFGNHLDMLAAQLRKNKVLDLLGSRV